jgi:membrane protein implicated in regulation of membrane protease activity
VEFRIWWIWIALAAIFAVAEIFTAGFFLMWFAVGAAVAGVLAILGVGGGWQWAAFIVVSVLLLAGSRRFAERFTSKQPPGVGADRLIGKKGVVLEEIDEEKNTGRARIEREEWRAGSATGETIPEGERIEVVRLEGTHLVVRPVKEE